MSKIILLCELPGSGKTTLANKIFQKLENSETISGDYVRQKFKDWDFSEDGRARQAHRMKEVAIKSKKQWVILDFVCPKNEYRKVINPDITIYMDTIESGRFEDTNKLFEVPLETVDYHFKLFDSDNQSDTVIKKLQTFDWKKETVQMLGRWQPWHDGHLELFKRCLKKTGQVCIQVRDCKDWDESNPFNFEIDGRLAWVSPNSSSWEVKPEAVNLSLSPGSQKKWVFQIDRLKDAKKGGLRQLPKLEVRFKDEAKELDLEMLMSIPLEK